MKNMNYSSIIGDRRLEHNSCLEDSEDRRQISLEVGDAGGAESSASVLHSWGIRYLKMLIIKSLPSI